MEEYCCKFIKEQTELCRWNYHNPLESQNVYLVYVPALNEYGIPMRDGTESIRNIRYCPWCGTRLPISKRDQWLKELANMGIDDPASSDIPEEFKSDEWWRRRKI